MELVGWQRGAVGGAYAGHEPRGDVTLQSRLLVLAEAGAQLILRVLAQLLQSLTDLPVLGGAEAARSVEQAGHAVQGRLGAEARVAGLEEGEDQIVTTIAPQFSITKT